MCESVFNNQPITEATGFFYVNLLEWRSGRIQVGFIVVGVVGVVELTVPPVMEEFT